MSIFLIFVKFIVMNIFGVDISDSFIVMIYVQFLSIFIFSFYNRLGFWKFKWQFGAGPG